MTDVPSQTDTYFFEEGEVRESLTKHELFGWVGNHGYDVERPGYPQALALDLKIMIDGLEKELKELREESND